jgi:tRNA (guanine-N7-)-methyltransferase
MTDIDPAQFIITRKRKKYKFALFANSPLCYEYEEWAKQAVDVVELGAGTGLFSVEMATRHPDKEFVAIDVKADRLQKGAGRATELGLKNIRFVRARADQMIDIILPNSLESLWLTFPDPFPRRRSAGRRMTHPNYLDLYRGILRVDGRFYLKHDNRDFFHWSLEQLVSAKWYIDELSFDLHDSDLDEEYKIQTTYESRWLSEGLVTNFVSAKPPFAKIDT